jgi:hypothetical protein
MMLAYTNNNFYQQQQQFNNNKRKRQEDDDNNQSIAIHSTKRQRLQSLVNQNESKKWSYMPREALFMVMQYFTKPQLLTIARTCTYWYNTSRVNLLWQNMTFQGFRVNTLHDIVLMLDSVFPKPYFSNAPIQAITLPKDCEQLDVEHFNHLRQMCSQLQEITLPVTKNQNQSIDNAVLRELALIPTLRRINVSTHTQITDEGLNYLAMSCPSLTHVTLDHCRGISTDAVVNLVMRCPQMVKLSTLLCANCIFDSSHLKQIAKFCSNLESASMEWGAVDDLNAVMAFTQSAKNLKQLHVRGCIAMTGECLSKLISSLPLLQQLRMICSDVTKINGAVVKSESLKEFSISNCESLKGTVVECPNLRKLHIDSIQSFQGIAVKSELNSNLAELILRSSRLDNFQSDKFMESWPQSIEVMELFDCTGIPQLTISSSKLQDLKLFMCSDVEELKIESLSLKKFTVDVCMQLRKSEIHCDNLNSCLWFSLPQMQAPIMDSLSLNSSSLESLSLPKCVNLREVQLSCDNLISINMSECKVLESMNLTCPKLQKLALSAPRIDFSPQYVHELALRCPEVHMLSIANIQSLTDKGLEQICVDWKKLNALIISNCSGLESPIIRMPLVKGLQLCDCSNLAAPKIFCPSLSKLFFKNGPSLKDEAIQSLTREAVPMLKFLDVTNCGIQKPIFVHSEMFELQLNQCQQLTNVLFTPHCSKLAKIIVNDAKSLVHFGLLQQPQQPAQPLLSVVEATLTKCEVLPDVALSKLVSFCPNMAALLVVQAHQIMRPTINSRALKHVQFADCASLIRPSLICGALQSISCKMCPNLLFNDIAELITVQQPSHIHQIQNQPPVIPQQQQQAQHQMHGPIPTVPIPARFSAGPQVPPHACNRVNSNVPPFTRVPPFVPPQLNFNMRPSVPQQQQQTSPRLPMFVPPMNMQQSPLLPPNFRPANIQMQPTRPQVQQPLQPQFIPPQMLPISVPVMERPVECNLTLVEVIKCDKIDRIQSSINVDKLVVDGCMRLEHIDVAGTICKCVTNSCLALKSVTLSGKVLNLFATHCPQLSQLNGVSMTNLWITDCPSLASNNNLIRR